MKELESSWLGLPGTCWGKRSGLWGRVGDDSPEGIPGNKVSQPALPHMQFSQVPCLGGRGSGIPSLIPQRRWAGLDHPET